MWNFSFWERIWLILARVFVKRKCISNNWVEERQVPIVDSPGNTVKSRTTHQSTVTCLSARPGQRRIGKRGEMETWRHLWGSPLRRRSCPPVIPQEDHLRLSWRTMFESIAIITRASCDAKKAHFYLNMAINIWWMILGKGGKEVWQAGKGLGSQESFAKKSFHTSRILLNLALGSTEISFYPH